MIVVAEEIHDEHRGQPHTDDSLSAADVTIVSYVTVHSTRSTSTLNVPVNEKPMSGWDCKAQYMFEWGKILL